MSSLSEYSHRKVVDDLRKLSKKLNAFDDDYEMAKLMDHWELKNNYRWNLMVAIIHHQDVMLLLNESAKWSDLERDFNAEFNQVVGNKMVYYLTGDDIWDCYEDIEAGCEAVKNWKNLHDVLHEFRRINLFAMAASTR